MLPSLPPTPTSCASLPLDIINVEQKMNDVILHEDPVNGSTTAATTTCWLRDNNQVNEIRSLKDLALSNCRLLYGSERFRFYDMVLCGDEESDTYCALLTCNINAETHILRKSINSTAVSAVRALVDRLQKDTAMLFTKYDIGSIITGQQGYINPETDKWELDDTKHDTRHNGPADLLPSGHTNNHGKRTGDYWAPSHAPRGPRAEQNGNKRARVMEHHMKEDENHISDLY